MKQGFIKVCAATPKIKVADCESNGTEMIRLLQTANREQVKLIVFPELCITGYTCGDLFLQELLFHYNQLHLF